MCIRRQNRLLFGWWRGARVTDSVFTEGSVRLRDVAVVHSVHLPDKNGIVPAGKNADAAPAIRAARMAFSSFFSRSPVK